MSQVPPSKTRTAVSVAKAARGGVVGVGAALVKSQTGRRVLLALVAVATIPALLMMLFSSLLITTATTVGAAGDTDRSVESVTLAGYEEEDIEGAFRQSANAGVPWYLALAVEALQGDDYDAIRLGDSLEGIKGFGAGAVYAPTGLANGESDEQKRVMSEERETYIAALEDYGLDEKDAGAAYDQAREWYLGSVETCTVNAPVNASGGEGEVQVEFDLPGGKRSLSVTQVNNAKLIIGLASQIDGMTQDAVIVILMAALTESGLLNQASEKVPESTQYPHDKVTTGDHDSVGFWQMRANWGSVKERMDPEYQVKAAFGGPDGPNGGSPRGLFDIPGWEDMTKGEAAQAFEVSAHPDRYDAFEELATELVRLYGDSVPTVSQCSGTGGSAMAGVVGHPLGDPTWGVSHGWGMYTTSFGTSMHRGMDFYGSSTVCDFPIYAVADGTVTHTGPESSWGNTVVIDHGNGVSTRYAHQTSAASSLWPQVGSEVKAGEMIGLIGNTGRSEACHLHFEFIIDGERTDPEPILLDSGVELTYQRGNPRIPAGATVVQGYPENAKRWTGD